MPTSTQTQTPTHTPNCTTNEQCDDGIECTDDSCIEGNCQNLAVDERCEDSDVCTDDLCDLVEGCKHTIIDSDGDGICDAQDPRQDLYDPTGCLYDELNGRVVRGGLVSVSGPDPQRITMGLDGSQGCYQFDVSGLPTGTEELYTLSVTPPPNCAFSTSCEEQPSPLDPNAVSPTLVLGAFNTNGFLVPHDCASNPFYLSFELEAGDPIVLNNNIPLQCEAGPVPAPVMSKWGTCILVIVMMLSGLFTFRARKTKA